jgi:hypothetical protein
VGHAEPGCNSLNRNHIPRELKGCKHVKSLAQLDEGSKVQLLECLKNAEQLRVLVQAHKQVDHRNSGVWHSLRKRLLDEDSPRSTGILFVNELYSPINSRSHRESARDSGGVRG